MISRRDWFRTAGLSTLAILDPTPSRKRLVAEDKAPEPLAPLNSFVLPGGRPAAAWCHVARTVCRRVERDVVTLARGEPVNPEVIRYLNRLSDLLFVLARACNDDGKEDVLWVPGKTMQGGE